MKTALQESTDFFSVSRVDVSALGSGENVNAAELTRVRLAIWRHSLPVPGPAPDRVRATLMGSVGAGTKTVKYAAIYSAIGSTYAGAIVDLCLTGILGDPHVAFSAATVIATAFDDAVEARFALDRWAASARGVDLPRWFDL